MVRPQEAQEYETYEARARKEVSFIGLCQKERGSSEQPGLLAHVHDIQDEDKHTPNDEIYSHSVSKKRNCVTFGGIRPRCAERCLNADGRVADDGIRDIEASEAGEDNEREYVPVNLQGGLAK